MAQTDKYKLRYPVDTDVADVPQDLKNLAEDVEKNLKNTDKKVEENTSNIENIKKEQEEQNTNIQNNKDRISILELTETLEEKYISIEDAVESTDNAGLAQASLSGATEQEVKEANSNKFNSRLVVYNAKYIQKIIDDNSFILHVAGTEGSWQFVTFQINNLKKNTNYSTRMKINNTNTAMVNFLTISASDNTTALFNATYTQNTVVNFNTGDNSTIFIRFHVQTYANTLAENTATFSDVQLEEGSYTNATMPAFKGYYAGTPSTENESKIKNVGGNINLLSAQELYTEINKIANSAVVSENDIVNFSTYYVAKNKLFSFIKYKEKQQYAFNLCVNHNTANVASLQVIYKDASVQNVTLGSNTEFKNYEFVTEANKTVDYVKFILNGGNHKLYIDCNKSKIEEGSVCTAYSKYNTGNTTTVIQNKNFLDNKNIVTSNIISRIEDKIKINATSLTVDTYNVPLYNNLNIKEDTYTVSWEIEGTWSGGNLVFYNKEGAKYAETSITNKNSYTVVGSLSKLQFFYIGITANCTIKMQIEKGTVATKKTASKQQEITFPFAENQRLMKGSYLAEDGIHHVRGQKTITGTDSSWIYHSANTEWARPYTLINNKKVGEDNNTANVTCDKMASISWDVGYNASNNNNGVFSYNGDNRVSFLIRKSELASENIPGVNTWLANNNLVIEYNLQNEVIEPYTAEQQTVWDKLQKVKTYLDSTHVYSVDTVEPVIDITYQQDPKTFIKNYVKELLGG